MAKTFKAFSKQLLGAKYESVFKSLTASGILFTAVYGSGFQITAAPAVLYLTSVLFTAGVMWQLLEGKRHLEVMEGMFMLPFDNRSFIFSYVSALGVHTLVTKTMPFWALFLAICPWKLWETALAALGGCMACAVTAAAWVMYRKGRIVSAIFWPAGILAVILLADREAVILTVDLFCTAAAVLYLAFADAYDFYCPGTEKKPVRHTGRAGSVPVYLLRYLMADKSCLINTAGLCGAACFLPFLFGKVQGMDLFPIGLAVLCMNTPVCTLLSRDPDLEQSLHILPGQAGRFCRKYCLLIFAVNGIIAGIYLCCWQIIHGGNSITHGMTVLFFSILSAGLSVVLEWKMPIRSWKTESDLWHHPRKYLVPLIMLATAALVSFNK